MENMRTTQMVDTMKEGGKMINSMGMENSF